MKNSLTRFSVALHFVVLCPPAAALGQAFCESPPPERLSTNVFGVEESASTLGASYTARKEGRTVRQDSTSIASTFSNGVRIEERSSETASVSGDGINADEALEIFGLFLGVAATASALSSGSSYSNPSSNSDYCLGKPSCEVARSN
jgi:hypothetical protein